MMLCGRTSSLGQSAKLVKPPSHDRAWMAPPMTFKCTIARDRDRIAMHSITIAAQQQIPMFCAYNDIPQPDTLWDIQLHELITEIAERLGHVHLQQLFQAFHAPIAANVRDLGVCEDLGAVKMK